MVLKNDLVNLENMSMEWLKDFSESTETLSSYIRKSCVNSLENKKSFFIKDVLAKKLSDLGYNVPESELEDFFKNRITRILFEGKSDVYEFILDYEEDSKTGIFLIGIIEQLNFSPIEYNKITGSIDLSEYTKSKILNRSN